MNAIIDDGTQTIRAVFFGSQMENLLQMRTEEIKKYKQDISSFQPVKEGLLGKIVKIVGRSQKNQMFDRLELVAQLVFPDPDPDEELKKVQEEAKVIE
jgi:hypothetical protein